MTKSYCLVGDFMNLSKFNKRIAETKSNNETEGIVMCAEYGRTIDPKTAHICVYNVQN